MSEPTLFAAPEAAAHGTAAGGTLEVTLALLLVVGLIVLLAWGRKRMRRFGIGSQDRIQVLSDRAVGPKERCVLVRVGDTDILLGVAQGSVRTLHVFPAGREHRGAAGAGAGQARAAQLQGPADAEPG